MKQLPVPIYILCLYLFFIVNSSYGQVDHSNEVFAFALDINGSKGSSQAIPEWKINTAKNIFEKLVEAKGVKNMPKPKFRMDNAEQRPAWAQPSKQLIVLEEKAFDICINLEKDSLNAIAALIAHELIHYYERHDWKDHFINKIGDKSSTNNVQTANLDLELQADHLGGLLAHVAGYNTLGIMPSLLEDIYDAYNLDHSKRENYPSIDERRLIAYNSDILLTKYSKIFDMSNFLIATEQYDLAKDYINYLLTQTKFESREIFNNLGTMSALKALMMYSESENIFKFPIEVDLSSRISTRGANEDLRNELIDEALGNFKTASILDDSYGLADLNIAAIYAIKQEWFDASYYVKKAIDKFTSDENSNGISDANVLQGIIAANQGDNDKAKLHFVKADSPLGRFNLCKLRGNENCNDAKSKKRPFRARDIDDVNLDKFYARIMQDKEQALLSIDLDNDLSFHSISKENSELLVALNSRILGEYVIFHVVKSPDVLFSRNIKVGSKKSAIKKQFGEPHNTITSKNSTIWIYPHAKAMFTLNNEDEIIEWCIYNISS